MAVKVALDTNAYADWKKGLRWHDEIARATEVHFSTTVLGELYYGFACGDRQGKNLGELQLLLEAATVEVDSIGVPTAEYYGELKKYLRQAGTLIPDNDIWIAAACIEHGCTLLTSDRHFECLPQLSSMACVR